MRPKIRTAFTFTFWDVFDQLGFWIAVNFFWFLSLFTIVLAPVTQIGLLAQQQKIIDQKPLSVRGFFEDCRRYWKKGLALGAILFFLIGMGIFNILFYSEHLGVLGLFLIFVSFLILIFILGVFFFASPLVVLGHNVKESLRLGFFLCVKRLGFFCKVLLVEIPILFLCTLSLAAIPVVMGAICASFWGNAFDQVRRSEEEASPRPLPEKTFKDVFFPFHD